MLCVYSWIFFHLIYTCYTCSSGQKTSKHIQRFDTIRNLREKRTMHFHYYTLQHLARSLPLEEAIEGCFSQSKNELIVEFHTFHLRIGCNTPATYVVPVDRFARARKNVVNLFDRIIEKKLKQVYVVPYERVLVMVLEEGYDLILKMHGPQANIMLRKGEEIIELFNNKLTEDWHYTEISGNFDTTALDGLPEVDEQAVLQQLRNISPIFEKQFAAEITSLMKQGQSFGLATLQIIKQVQDNTFYLKKEAQKIKFYLFEPAENKNAIEVREVIPALQLFLRTFFQFDRYLKQYKKLNKEIRTPYKKTQKLYQSFQKNIQQLESERNPEELGHILMANLHHIQPGQQKAILEDYYEGGTVAIKLKPDLSPQENARLYYEKHKQQKIRLQYLKKELNKIENRLVKEEGEVEAFDQVPRPDELKLGPSGFDLDEIQGLRQFFKNQIPEKQQPRHPFREFEHEGFQIFVGKNARNNDELSFKFANKEDLWLHAKDVSGSHVVIRQQAGKKIPVSVLEYAASLAAYYSKRKNDTLVPVIYTPRKYIRKRKGDPPGAVVVDREEVVMIEPVRN